MGTAPHAERTERGPFWGRSGGGDGGQLSPRLLERNIGHTQAGTRRHRVRRVYWEVPSSHASGLWRSRGRDEKAGTHSLLSAFQR